MADVENVGLAEGAKRPAVETTSDSNSDYVTESVFKKLYDDFENTKNELQSSINQHKTEMKKMNEKIDGIDEKLKQQVKQLLTDGKLNKALDENKEPKEEIEVPESKNSDDGKQGITEKDKADGHREGMSTEPDPKSIRNWISRLWELLDRNRISALFYNVNWWRVICLVVIGATMISALGAGFVALYAGFQSLSSGVAFSRGIYATSVGVTSGAYHGAILGSIGGGLLGYKTSYVAHW